MYNKYLKYKNKYLSLKKMFGGTKKVNVIAVLPNREERVISFSDDEELINAVARELSVKPTQIMVCYTGSVVSTGLTAEDCGIDNHSRLTITFLSKTIKIGTHSYNTLEEYYIAGERGRNPNKYPTLSSFGDAEIDSNTGLSEKYPGFHFNFELFKSNDYDTGLAHIYKLIITER